jgi:3-deoxy-D-manno-octulosonic-acid transferase
MVNGRISPRSFGRYRRVRRLLARVLDEVDLFLMQGPAHADRARAIGAPPARVRVTGNLKFDALEAPEPPEALVRLFGGRDALWVAGSTVEGEEPLVLEAFRAVRARVPSASLVLVPRHPERFPAVPALVEAAGFRSRLRSALVPGQWADEVVVLDTMGELARLYPLAAIAFVGGSLVPAGGHNVLEPAVAGRAVVVGPHMENFQEIADEFRAEGALVQVRSAAELAEQTAALLLDRARREGMGERARALVARNRGALARTVEGLAELVA